MNQDNWTPCSHCDGTGRSPFDMRARCPSTRPGLFEPIQCMKPEGHGGPIHTGSEARDMYVSWKNEDFVYTTESTLIKKALGLLREHGKMSLADLYNELASQRLFVFGVEEQYLVDILLQTEQVVFDRKSEKFSLL